MRPSLHHAAILVAALVLAACAGPATTVRTPDTRPALAFQGAPPGAVLVLDGQALGDPAAWDGQPRVLRVEPGTHHVVVRAADGTVLLEQRIFVESELKTIVVH
jgi:regulator of RNase E activity RraA